MNNNITEHYNWKVSYERKFNFNSIELWKIISQPSNLELFHPFCKNNEVLKWEKEKSVDFIEYYNKKVLKRKHLQRQNGRRRQRKRRQLRQHHHHHQTHHNSLKLNLF